MSEVRELQIKSPRSDLIEDVMEKGGMDIFMSLVESAATSHELAMRIGWPLAKVNYILNRLILANVVVVTSSKMGETRVESIYQAAVDTFSIIFGNESTTEERTKAILYMFKHMQRNLFRDIASSQIAAFSLSTKHVSRDAVKEFKRRLENLIDEFEMQPVGINAMGTSYTMAVALYSSEGDDFKLNEE